MISEAEIVDIEARAELAGDSKDPDMLLRYAELAAKQDVPALARALRAAITGADGGSYFANWLRGALKLRIADAAKVHSASAQRVATLASDVRVHSIAVHDIAGEGRVMVDVRLEIGDTPRRKLGGVP